MSYFDFITYSKAIITEQQEEDKKIIGQ